MSIEGWARKIHYVGDKSDDGSTVIRFGKLESGAAMSRVIGTFANFFVHLILQMLKLTLERPLVETQGTNPIESCESPYNASKQILCTDCVLCSRENPFVTTRKPVDSMSRRSAFGEFETEVAERVRQRGDDGASTGHVGDVLVCFSSG